MASKPLVCMSLVVLNQHKQLGTINALTPHAGSVDAVFDNTVDEDDSRPPG